MRYHHITTLSLTVIGLQTSLAAAQPAAERPADTTPAPILEELPPPPPPPPAYAEPASTPTAACTPACRAGYACVSGQCVSACNPPCGPGEACVNGGQCIASTPAAPQYDADMTGDSPLSHPEGYREHDGFMLRLTAGFGGASSKFAPSNSDSDLVLSGVSGTFGIDLGASVAENVVIHARFANQIIVDPSASIDGMDVGSNEDVTVSSLLFGPAITYYFMPVNLYLTGAIGASWVNIDFNNDALDDDSPSSDAGFGLNFDVGKEWWAGGNWGLGLAGRFWYSAIKQDEAGTQGDINFLGFCVLFSGTYQ